MKQTRKNKPYFTSEDRLLWSLEMFLDVYNSLPADKLTCAGSVSSDWTSVHKAPRNLAKSALYTFEAGFSWHCCITCHSFSKLQTHHTLWLQLYDEQWTMKCPLNCYHIYYIQFIDKIEAAWKKNHCLPEVFIINEQNKMYQ